MPDSVSTMSVYLMPGAQIQITIPVNTKNNNGFFARTESVPASMFPELAAGSDSIPLERGFLVEDDTVGTVTPTTENSLSVVYEHNRPYSNAIWFFAATGERALINVITVPIHDHSTIAQGGPAYGTYFDDDIER